MPEPVDGGGPADAAHALRKDPTGPPRAPEGVRASSGPDPAAGRGADRAPDPPTGPSGAAQAELLDRLRHTPGLESLVAEAVATWRTRVAATDSAAEDDAARTPGWRAFSDAFPTFWEFSNRPR